MKEESIRAMILFDSLEDFKLNHKTMSHAIQGLLKCQGSFSEPRTRCTLRACLPAELYFSFVDLSSNPNKDFQNQLVLHWHARELLGLAAEKHYQYMKLYHSDILKELPPVDLDTRSGIISYWEEFLPEKLLNRIEIEERTIAYILRHTQLLPRQLLIYLNEICRESADEDILELKSRPDIIVESTHSKEAILAKEILSAYKYRYPLGEEACSRCIPYLHLHFPEGLLMKVHRMRASNLPGLYDFEAFKKMMIEIGVFGRVEAEKERYFVGRFEYTEPYRLLTTSDDYLCIHPLFSEVFNAIKPAENPRMIYPFGTDINETEWRVY